ncbi:M16 family metallopeptidase [Planctobacterium marinum]|uniref:Peptidase M16 n=1 Tax=Planctobacterium marinum TaxID=1631968 RepID=A0AA48KVH8_9ALTE|nr:peptidase M16 [Planctobacterium marinum]
MVVKFRLFWALSLLSLAACQYSGSVNTPASEQTSLPSGIVLLEDKSDAQGDYQIPYKKYQLDNGLTFILHQDDSDPLVHVDVTYHVGSSREEPGKSGFAHFFEHMMFQGSENVADEQHFELITEAGGNMNGTTNSDRTNYYQTVPANQLEKVLWLEADRMGFLLDAVTQEKFEVQRETVKNERAQRVDNQPYGLRSEKIAEALYPKDHPYSWPVIGYIEDLNRVDVNDLKAFFVRWYGPNSAVLSIGGAINEAQTLKWVNKYFGGIPRGQKVEKLAKMPVKLAEDRYLTIEDDVHLPLLQMTFPTVYVRHEDEAPLDVLSDILGGGKTSLFYKNLVKEGWAVHAGVGHPCRELACQFELIALPNPQRVPSLAQLQTIMRKTLEEFEQRGVSDDDLQRTKANIKSGTVFGLQSVAGKVSTLASNQIFSGDPDKVQYDIERYSSVTKADVMRVFNAYIKDKASVVLSIVPTGQQAMQAKAPDFVKPERTISAKVTEEPVAPAPAEDDFDRSVVPKAGPNPVVNVPDFWQTELNNGISLMAHETKETPTVTLVINLEGGPLLDPIDKAGLASMTAMMMSEATQNYSNEAMANELAKLGSSISFSAGGRFTSVYVNSLEENIDATLALLQEKLFRPAFHEADFVRLKTRLMQSLQQADKNPQTLSSKAVIRVLYGEQNRIAIPDSGTVQTLNNITLEDVKQFYNDYYNAHMASVISVGSLAKPELLKALDFINTWPAKAYEIPEYKPFPEFEEKAIYLVNDADAAQSIVAIIKPFLAYDATGEHFKTNLMNFPLGGMFNSRINLNLREDKGYTYGARSSFVGGKTLGRFQAGGAINKEHTVAALKELFAEIETYQKQGMTQQELEFMRRAYTQGDALKYETPGSKARFLRQMTVYGLDKSYPAQQNNIIANVTLDTLNQLAAKHLQTDSMQVVLVADTESLAEEIKQWAESQGRKVIPLEI